MIFNKKKGISSLNIIFQFEPENSKLLRGKQHVSKINLDITRILVLLESLVKNVSK